MTSLLDEELWKQRWCYCQRACLCLMLMFVCFCLPCTLYVNYMRVVCGIQTGNLHMHRLSAEVDSEISCNLLVTLGNWDIKKEENF